LCNLIATSLWGYYVYPNHAPVGPLGSCHGDPDCIRASITFGFLLFALLNSAACCAFAGIACAVKDQSKKARLQAEKEKPRREQRRRPPPRRRRPRERTPIYYYYDDDYYYYWFLLPLIIITIGYKYFNIFTKWRIIFQSTDNTLDGISSI